MLIPGLDTPLPLCYAGRMKWVILAVGLLFCRIPVFAQEKQPVMVQLSEDLTKGERWVNLLKLSPAEYKDFGTTLVAAYEKDREKFATSSKKILISLFGLPPDHQVVGVFDIDPLFNRSLLFASVAAENKIKLDDKDLLSFQQDCLAFSLKAKTDKERAFIAGIASEVIKHNSKLQ